MKYRHEYKCKISILEMIELRNRIEQVMKRDKFADSSGKYIVKSLYFDNYMDKAVREKEDGLNIREKFRIRYYNDDLNFMRLEKKNKRNNLCNKESAVITRQMCENIIDGEKCSVFDTDNNLLREFYSKMQYQVLRPRSIVVYSREAFVYDEGNVRVTFDSNVRGTNNVYSFLENNIPTISLFKYIILEVKWDEYLPQVIRDIVQIGTKSISSYSKYVSTRFI